MEPVSWDKKSAAPGGVDPVGHVITCADTLGDPARNVAYVERDLPPGGIPAYLAARKDGTRSFVLWADPQRRTRLATVITTSAGDGVATYHRAAPAVAGVAWLVEGPHGWHGHGRTRAGVPGRTVRSRARRGRPLPGCAGRSRFPEPSRAAPGRVRTPAVRHTRSSNRGGTVPQPVGPPDDAGGRGYP
ncbi:hypothetical protein [Streptomyces sp. NBC_01320]|uniref:hypothetical protein n=1 Tax=Streptomyces sp. NBC_01320 TaxID=2903824 RepID=UPI002E12DE92|nr:hypothetical protein OG395_42730 [Streptomyces sp. NBC_01320]